MKTIFIKDEPIPYDSEVVKGGATHRGCKASILRVPRQTVLLPEESLNIPVPPDFKKELVVAVEPRLDSPSMKSSKSSSQWFKPHITELVDGNMLITNTSESPILLRRHEQIAMIRPVTTSNEFQSSTTE